MMLGVYYQLDVMLKNGAPQQFLKFFIDREDFEITSGGVQQVEGQQY